MKVAMLDDWTSSAAEHVDPHPVSQNCDITIFTQHLERDALIAQLQDFDVICVMRERSLFDSGLIAALPNLKAIITNGMNNAAIDLEACAARGIIVSGSPTPSHATAELAMTLIGALARQIVPNHIAMMTQGWQSTAGRDLRGATLGILGLGRLGTTLANFGKAYGMTVVAWSQNLTKEDAEAQGVTYLPKEAFFATADYISVHLRLSERVRGLISTPEFEMMKPSACLVNTSRAPIIDTKALITALQTGQIGGAAIDVYDHEPVPSDDPIRTVPNLILSPHIGYVTQQTMATFYNETLTNLAAIIEGAPIRRLTS